MKSGNYRGPKPPERAEPTRELPGHTRGILVRFRPWAAAGLLAGAFLFAYWEVLVILTDQWRNNVMYTHGFLIPLISLYLVWVTRKSLAFMVPKANPLLGAGVLVLSLGMLLAGNVGGVIVLQEVTLPITIAGMVLLLLGVPFLRKLWLPIAYLFFMVPFWEELITGRLHEPFQQFSARNGVALLQLLGIPVYLQGLYVELPGVTLEVARACSGVNHLIAVVAIGIPLAYLYMEGWVRKAVLLSVAVLVAVFGNVLRIALIGVFAYHDWGSPLHGPLHIFQGLFVSVIGYVALFSLLPLLSRGLGPDRRDGGQGTQDEPPQPAPHRPAGRRQAYAVAVTAILLGSAGVLYRVQSPAPVPLQSGLEHLPDRVGAWRGSPAPSAFSELFRTKGVDEELSRVYHNPQGKSVGLYIGYFEQQTRKKKVSSYLTDVYHRQSTRTTLALPTQGMLDANQFVVGGPGQEQVGLFWYDMNGRTAAGPYEVRALTIWEALRHGRTNAGFVAVTTGLSVGEGVPEAASRLREFSMEIYPVLGRYLPR